MAEEANMKRVLHMKVRALGEPAQVLALIRSAAPFYRSMGAAGFRVLQNVDDPAQMLVEDNSVRALVPDGGALAVAIRSTAGGRVSLRRNALFGEGTGIGMQCANADGAVRDNSLLGFATAISGCSSDGGNTVKP